MNKLSIYQQLLLNAIPVAGYWFWGWSMFAIIYIYWVEALIISIFVCLKIAWAKGEDSDGYVAPLGRRIKSGMKYLFLRVGILMFYWIFILLFVAMGQGKYSLAETTENVKILAFVNESFNLAVLAFFLSQILEFLRDFIYNDAYKNTPSSNYKLFFDARTVVIHVVVVLGTFAFQYLEQFTSVDNRLPGLGFVFIMFFVKSIADTFLYLISKKKIVAA